MNSSTSGKISVNLISESEFTVQGHGVHTAYVEMRDSLLKLPGVAVSVNKGGRHDIVHVHTVGPYSLFRLLTSGRKKVVSAHVVPDSFIGSLKGARWWRPLAVWWLRFFYNRAELIFAVSDYTKTELQKLNVKRRIEVLYNTIDTTKYSNSSEKKAQARKKLSIAPDAFIVVSAGQVQPRKRVDMFIEMAAALPELTFIWVGGIPFGSVAADNHAMQEVMAHAPSNVTFTGVIPLEQVADYYRAADVFVLLSDQETFGLVVIEAAAAGLPIILRDIADYDTTFRPHGQFVASVKEAARAVERLRTDAKFYQAQQHAASHIAKRFDSAQGATQLLQYYRELCKK